MLLFTSIKPPPDVTATVYQIECLNSWRAAGFSPVSVNGPSEARKLSSLDVEIEILPRDGKPRIGDILSAIRTRSESFSGIINADICIIPCGNVAENLRRGLAGHLAMGWRTEIGTAKRTATCSGFDAFFFDTRLLPVDDAGFSIGDAWWDLWFPWACEQAGAKVETIGAPLFMHRVHPQNWSREQWVTNGRRFVRLLRSSGASTPFGLHRLARKLPAQYHAAPKAISITGSPYADAVLIDAGSAMLKKTKREQPSLAGRIVRRVIRSGYSATRMMRPVRHPAIPTTHSRLADAESET
jgi:hypothetical protein